MHENLCLQLDVDRMSLEIDKLKQQISRNDLQSNLKYVNSKTKSSSSSEKKEKKVVRINSNTTIIKHKTEERVSLALPPEPVTKIFERIETPGVPLITEFSNEAKISAQSSVKSISSSHSAKSTEGSMALMQVSKDASPIFGSENGSEPVRTQSAPEIVQSSIFSDSSKSCESMHVKIKNCNYDVVFLF